MLISQTVTYSKLQDASALHIKWYGTQEYCTGSATKFTDAIRFFVRLNGADCTTPTRIESWWTNDQVNRGFCNTIPKYVEGICKTPLAAGPITITLHVGAITASTRTLGVTLGGTSYLMVEEHYDNL